MAEDRTNADITGMIRGMQALFDPSGTVAPGPERMLALHREMARQTQTFARHWLARRQDAAETGVAALQTLAATQGTDPAAALRAITDWQRGSVRRLDADLQEWIALCTQITRTATAQSVPDAGEADDATASGTPRAEPAATTNPEPRPTKRPHSRHATPV
jgi:hypothetical protein